MVPIIKASCLLIAPRDRKRAPSTPHYHGFFSSSSEYGLSVIKVIYSPLRLWGKRQCAHLTVSIPRNPRSVDTMARNLQGNILKIRASLPRRSPESPRSRAQARNVEKPDETPHLVARRAPTDRRAACACAPGQGMIQWFLS